jgi:hypothetical protein
MQSYFGLELLANDHVQRRVAEADHDRRVRQVQLACKGNSRMTHVLVLILIIGGLVLLDVLALRFGYDSRDGFRSHRPWD